MQLCGASGMGELQVRLEYPVVENLENHTHMTICPAWDIFSCGLHTPEKHVFPEVKLTWCDETQRPRTLSEAVLGPKHIVKRYLKH